MDAEAAVATLEKARTQVAKEDAQNVEFSIADGPALTFLDDMTFDVVHAHQVLQHVNDPARLLSEMRRVIRPGGIVATRSWDDGTIMVHPPSERIAKTHEVFRRVMEDWGREFKAGRNPHTWVCKAGFEPSGIRVTSSN